MESSIREPRVEIPLHNKPEPPVDIWGDFAKLTSRPVDEIPLNRPLTHRGELVFIGIVAALLTVVSVTGFIADKGRTGVGWLLVGLSIAIVAALYWAHRRGGFERPLGRHRPSSSAVEHSIPAPALDPSVRPTTFEIASMRDRVIGGAAEQLVSATPAILLISLDLAQVLDGSESPALASFALVVFLFGTTFESWVTNGRTIGRRLVGTRVVRTDGQRMTFGVAARREFFKMINGQFFGLPYLGATRVDPLHRSPADLRADTLVVCDP